MRDIADTGSCPSGISIVEVPETGVFPNGNLLESGRESMQSGLYVGLSSQLALQKRLDTVAHNMANVNTPGFRAEEIKFEALVAQAGDKDVAFASPGDSYLSLNNGGITQTGNPLDFAVSGGGWLAFQGPGGTAYTRDGRMQMSSTGALTTLTGYPVLDAGGTTINLDPNAGPPTVSRDGMIQQGNNQIGALGLFSISPRANLTRVDNSGVVPDIPAQPIVEFTKNGVLQGHVEGSNVNPVMEMTRLITIQRTFDSVAAGMHTTETSMTDAIKTLGGSA